VARIASVSANRSRRNLSGLPLRPREHIGARGGDLLIEVFARGRNFAGQRVSGRYNLFRQRRYSRDSGAREKSGPRPLRMCPQPSPRTLEIIGPSSSAITLTDRIAAVRREFI
jgi:hypothetical protein